MRMRLRGRLLAATGALTVAAVGLALVLVAPLPRTTSAGGGPAVELGDDWFCDPGQSNCPQPHDKLINAGETVTWVWGPGGAGTTNDHSTTHCADDFLNCAGPKEWNSFPLTNSGTFQHTFNSPGTYLYRCENHALTMKGRIIVAATPVPTPSPSPTPAPTGTPTPTATAAVSATPTPSGQTPTPTATPPLSPTPTPSAAPTPTPTIGGGPVNGDVDCNGLVDSVDALKVLRRVASLPVSQEPGCPGLGTPAVAGAGERLVGDVDCDGDVDAIDALKILRHVAGLPVSQQPGCDAIGT